MKKKHKELKKSVKVKSDEEIQQKKTWLEKYEAGLGLTAGKCSEGDIVKIGNHIGTILYVNFSRVQIRNQSGGEIVNIAPSAQVDEVLGKEDLKKANNGSVNRPATWSERKETVMTKSKKGKTNGKKSVTKKAVPEKQQVAKRSANGKAKMTIRSIVLPHVTKDVSYEETEKAVKKAFPKSKFNKGHFSWYKMDMRRKGLL